MNICRDDIKKLGKAGVVSIVGGVLITYFTCPSCSKSSYQFGIVALFSSLVWFFIWLGNRYLGLFLDRKIPWTESPIRRFVVGVPLTIVYTVVVMIVLMEGFEFIVNFDFGDSYLTSLYISVGITILVSLILHSRGFLLSWREAAKDAEKLQKENAIAKYESLKSQVNPHFLFNSLNALTNLVYEDQNKAVKFIKQLSDVYRYVLDTRERGVVSIKEELDFLHAYLFLQKIRFADNLKIDINVSGNGQVAPLALQLLIENAIKHNIVSREDPLIITISEGDGYITVENNLQKKRALGEPSSGMGLDNICRRYEFLSDRKVKVVRSETVFTVRLPLIE
jgi:sensor histidine kinase YesM